MNAATCGQTCTPYRCSSLPLSFCKCQNIIQHSVASFLHHILLRCIFCRAPIPCFTYDNYLNSWAKPNDPFPETPCGNCPVHHESSAPGFPDECEAPGHKDESKKIQKITNSRTRSAKTGPRNMQTWAISLSQAVGRIKIFELKINWVPSWQRQTLKRLFPSCLKASASPSICVNGSKSSDVEWHDNDKACPICESTSAISNLAKFAAPRRFIDTQGCWTVHMCIILANMIFVSVFPSLLHIWTILPIFLHPTYTRIDSYHDMLNHQASSPRHEYIILMHHSPAPKSRRLNMGRSFFSSRRPSILRCMTHRHGAVPFGSRLCRLCTSGQRWAWKKESNLNNIKNNFVQKS